MKLIIVADLGLLRAYREVKHKQDHNPRLEPVDAVPQGAARELLSEQMSDQAGRFPRGMGANLISGDLSAGERLSLETEETRRLVNGLAETIAVLLGDEAATECWLAASAPIHKQLLDALTPEARGKISRVLASNLARTDPQELLGHFAKAAANDAA